ncbi:cullin family protein [Catovirus CTV1]|uniref:Cullin family protein n=1 Tax=Catovirus CTV1 TaxID=1977631 RepID=A0A1V0SC29_9VIRU|nr:cullin family protein [Catovirus CTV1]
MNTQINFQTFDVFGKKYMLPSNDNFKLLNGLSLYNNDVTELFVDCGLKILNNISADINKVKLNLITQSMIQRGYEFTMNAIIKIFELYLSNLADEIQRLLLDNNLNASDFLQIYDTFNTRSFFLAKSLHTIDKSILQDNSNKKSTILLVKSYMFYRMILTKIFNYTDKEKYLYEILPDTLQSDKRINELSKLFKIIQFYERLSYVVKNEREKYFDLSLNNKFVLKESETNCEFINTISNVINDNIKTVIRMDTSDTKLISEKVSHIRDMINMGCCINNDKTMFFNSYKHFLTERLLSKQTNTTVENELLTSFNYFDCPEIYAKMKYQILDTNLSQQHNEGYKNVRFKITSEKYKNIDTSTLDKSKAEFMVARSYAWDLANDDIMNIPSDLSIYFDIFNGYYKTKNPDRELNCQYDKSTAMINLELGGKNYNVCVTLSQLVVLTVINDSGAISARNIATQLSIPLKKLGSILNSLMSVKLLNRENGAANDPELLFSINQNCSFADENVSLI